MLSPKARLKRSCALRLLQPFRTSKLTPFGLPKLWTQTVDSRGAGATAIDKRLAAFDVNEDGSVSIDELLVLAEKQKRLQEKVD